MGVEELIPYNQEDEAAIWKQFDRTPESAADDVAAIKNWLRSQPHIPEILPDTFIKNFLRVNKCSIERTKQAIDYYYSIRNFVPEFFTHHPLSPEMIENYKVWYLVSLPKRMGFDRVSILKLADYDPELLNVESLFSHALNVGEMRMLNDCIFKDIYIIDLTGTKAAHLLKIPLTLLHKFIVVTDKIYSSRVSAVHLISGFESILSMIKGVLKPKIRERVHIHKNYDSLHKLIPKEVLPKDLGGEEKSLKELAEMQFKCLEEMKERFDVLVKMKSNEELRPGSPVNDEFFGFYGNFKKIEVD